MLVGQRARDPRGIARKVGILLVILAIPSACLGVWHGGWFCFVAVAFVMIAMMIVPVGGQFDGRGPCPCCGAEVHHFPESSPGVPCGACREYLRVDKATMTPTPPDHVASVPTYLISLQFEKTPAFGHLCATCGRVAEGTVACTLRQTFEGSESKMMGVRFEGSHTKEWSVVVPLCLDHLSKDGTVAGTGVEIVPSGLLIRSYAVWRETMDVGRNSDARKSSE